MSARSRRSADGGPTDGAPRCLCGAPDGWDRCCGRYLAGRAEAPTAEALMRARYSAHAAGDAAFLRRSWHPDTCPEAVTDASVTWTGLEVHQVLGGRALDRDGTVEFAAHYRRFGEAGVLSERSRFVRLGTRWVYLDGEQPVP